MTEAERKSCPWNCPIQQGLSQVTTCRKDLITHMQQEHNQYFCPHCCIRVSENLMMTHMYECKPPFSVDQLIVQAIQSSHEQQLTSSDICTYISQKYPYYKIWDKSWQEYIMTNLSNDPNFIGFPRYENRISKYFWKMKSTYGIQKNTKIPNSTTIPISKQKKHVRPPSSTASSSSNEHMNNLQEKGLKDISTPQLTSEISRIVTSLSVAEEKRVAEALNTSGISFELDETVLKQEVGIKEEKESKPNILVEAGPSKESNYASDITTKNTQNVDLFKCHVCDKHFNQYDLELHFVTDHLDEELL